MPTTITKIKTLYVFVEIAIDSQHLIQTIRLNFPTNREQFHETLLDSEAVDSQIPAGRPIGPGEHLRIEGPSKVDQGQTSAGVEQVPATSSSNVGSNTRFALVSTIQFVAALSRLKDDLTTDFEDPNKPVIEGADRESNDLEISRPRLHTGKYEAMIPRIKPLSPGEILGCTSPHLDENIDALM